MRLDRWRLKDFDEGGGLAVGAERGRGDGWIDVPAPGDTYLALIAAGRLAHPFEDRHETDAAWVRDREWWWRTTFEASPPAGADERVRLVFEGLDTFASIYLDGELVAQTDNMFGRYAFEVGDRLRNGGAHTLAIRFDPTASVTAARHVPVWSAFTDRVTRSRRNLMRKAQFGWGWDWGPDLPTVGVWRPARLERRTGGAVADVCFTTLALFIDRADARVSIEVEPFGGEASLRAEVELTDPDGAVVAAHRVPITNNAALDLTVPAPRLWWTADLGGQPLYTLTVRLWDGDDVVDERTRRVGIRQVALDTADDPAEPGASFFRFCLNGALIFAKGVCWVPASSFVGEVDEVRYRDLLGRAVGANMNMIRVWGGGVYEPDLFYDLCDEMGLLVWQDFMFACAHYPEDEPPFVDSVRCEVEEQVRRLRGHACLALWCGNNENQAMHNFNAQVTGEATPLLGLLYYDRIIPDLLRSLDPATPYWPGSPSGGPSPNSMRAGDVHNWTVWHGVPPVPDKDMVGPFDASPEGVAYTRYAEDKARFVSEFGIQAAPALATLRRWMAPEDLALGSPGLLGRVKDKPEKANAMMLPVTGLPATLEDYVDFSMWTQAEGLKFGIEHYRRRKPHCSGTLIWQYDDCWPCVSWSLIDYDGVGKASLYAVTRAFAPVLASFRPLGKPLEDEGFELWITNDRLESVSGRLVVDLTRLSGGREWSEVVSFEVGANASRPVWRGSAPAATDRLLTVRSEDGRFASNRYLLAPIKRLALTPGARPAVALAQTAPGEIRADLAASDYLAFVNLTCEDPAARFSDNYFDMAAGETRTIAIRATGVLSPDDIKVSCWNDTHPR